MKLFFVLLLSVLTLTSCKEPAPPSPELKAPPLAADTTLDDLAEQLVEAMAPMTEAVSSAKDTPSAEAARKQINEIADQVVLLVRQAEQLPQPSPEEIAATESAMSEKTKDSQRELRRLFIEKSYVLEAEALANLTVAMDEFSTKMLEVQPIMERYFVTAQKEPEDVTIDAEAISETIEVLGEVEENVQTSPVPQN